MKELVGRVINYNGYTGRIVVDNKEYILLDNNIVHGEVINNDDKVSFIPEEIDNILIARFVKRV